MSREAMKLALDALVFAAYEDIEYDDACDQKVREARNALRQALSQPEQEPVAWQPIESAPKTGRKVILFYKNRLNVGRTVIARWLTDEQATEIDADDVGLEGGWYECIDNWDDFTEVSIHEGEPSHWMPLPAPPIEALRQALETKQEPVAWISDSPTKGNGKQLHWTKSEAWRWSSNITPLYTAPSKQWVGLTDGEIDILSCETVKGNKSVNWLCKVLEAKLREKNI